MISLCKISQHSREVAARYGLTPERYVRERELVREKGGLSSSAIHSGVKKRYAHNRYRNAVSKFYETNTCEHPRAQKMASAAAATALFFAQFLMQKSPDKFNEVHGDSFTDICNHLGIEEEDAEEVPGQSYSGLEYDEMPPNAFDYNQNNEYGENEMVAYPRIYPIEKPIRAKLFINDGASKLACDVYRKVQEHALGIDIKD